MTKEQLARIKANRQFAIILKKILSKHILCDEILNADPRDPLFDEICELMDFRTEIVTLSQTLSQVTEYQQMLLEEEEV